MDLEQEFTNATGRCPDNDVQYYADWLEEKVKKLTTDNNESTPCQQHRYRVFPESGDIKCVDCNKLLRGS